MRLSAIFFCFRCQTPGLESIQNKYLDGRSVANCSEETKTEIDKEVVRILKERYNIAKKLLSENRDALDEISEYLIDKETITGDEFMEIFNKVRESRKTAAEDEIQNNKTEDIDVEQ